MTRRRLKAPPGGSAAARTIYTTLDPQYWTKLRLYAASRHLSPSAALVEARVLGFSVLHAPPSYPLPLEAADIYHRYTFTLPGFLLDWLADQPDNAYGLRQLVSLMPTPPWPEVFTPEITRLWYTIGQRKAAPSVVEPEPADYIRFLEVVCFCEKPECKRCHPAPTREPDLGHGSKRGT